jgi:PadR family transcriptional regulator, regulatory protein PadR
MPKTQGDKLRGHLEMLILASLEKGEAHGMEILTRLEAGGCGLLRFKEGSLYPALYRLEAAGQIAGSWEKGPHGRRGARRCIYRLTIKGARRLKAERGDFQQFVSVVSGLLGVSSRTQLSIAGAIPWLS